MAMTKSGVEYCDYSFNAVTGCFHSCRNRYCYAAKIARRFALPGLGDGLIHDLSEPIRCVSRLAAYPYGFALTFRRYKLDEPSKIKKPSTVFVSDMGDLFGEWVPDEWIEAVFAACQAAPQHRYLFLTKNPRGYDRLSYALRGEYDDDRKYPNLWFGTTIETQSLYDARAAEMDRHVNARYNSFISFEPLQENIADLDAISGFGWVIIGRDTSPGADRSIPKREWVENIVAECKAENVPVFMKSNLAEAKGKRPALFDKSELIQEFPWDNGGRNG